MLLVLSNENCDAHQHFSTEWIAVDDPWLALAEILHQDREAAARAGWGLQPVGRSYLVTVGPFDQEMRETLHAALARWSPESRTVELERCSEIEQFELQMTAARTTPHPLRKNEPIVNDSFNDDATAPADVADANESDENTSDAPAPIPLHRSPPVAWSKKFSSPKSPELHADEGGSDAEDDGDDEDESPKRSVTPEELSLLLQTLDDEEEDEVEAPSP